MLDAFATWSFDVAMKSTMMLFCSWHAFANFMFANDVSGSFSNGVVVGGDDSSLGVKHAHFKDA